MKHTVRWNEETQRFEIIRFTDNEDGTFTIIETVRVFPEGTMNDEACREYDLWRAENP